MYAVEFQTVIKNGMIEIPKTYQAGMPSQVRVIVLADKPVSPELKNDNIISRLMKSPKKVGNFIPMKREEIYDRS